MNDKIIDFTIGADPEFACLNRKGGVVSAGDYVSEDDDVEFGADGNGITFELRPGPSKDPLKIVNNIHDIFVRQTIDKPEFLKFKWVAGSWHSGYPMGGHVHFGLKASVVNFADAINHLDHYVGVVSLLLEIKSHGAKRRGDGYGGMGDMRVQPWGFEYRPMSSWLSSPYVAAAMLCLSKTVMYELLNNSKFEWHKFAVRDDFYKMNQERVLSKFPEIWNDITKMHLYQTYKPYIDLIYFLVKNRLTWIPATGMKESWGVVNMQSCISNKIGLDVLWHRYNSDPVGFDVTIERPTIERPATPSRLNTATPINNLLTTV